MNECTIVISGVGLFAFEYEASGSFEGIPHDPSGGNVMLGDGSFCARLAH